MADYADLEIGIHRWDQGNYAIDLRFLAPKQDAEDRLLDTGPALVAIDRATLPEDPAEYGRALTRWLFATEALRSAFRTAKARAGESILRFRIFVGPSAPELHELKWETLLDPDDPWVKDTPAGAPGANGAAAGSIRPAFLATNERIPFSRYLTAVNFRSIPPRTDDVFRVLAVISNPLEISRYKVDGVALAPVDVERELSVLKAIATRRDGREVRLTTLASGGQASLKSLIEHLRQGEGGEGSRQPYDMLYIVAHGTLRSDVPVIYFEDDSGGVDPVYGAVLVNRIKDLAQLPRVVVLVSCQSAGEGGESCASDSRGVLAALGPSLADAGVPAVLAMLGSVSMKTMAEFLPVFLDALQNDGQIDVAVAAGRGRVRDRFDSWMPVLFSRLRSGRVWYKVGMEGTGSEFENWEGLLTYIESGDCTPVLGSGLVESVIGSTREIARRWADTYHFPMSPFDREDLPQVAQYLSVNQGNAYPKRELELYLKRELQRRFRDELASEANGLALLDGDADLDEIISALGARRRRGPEGVLEPHRILASLPCPVYVTTNHDRLMADALGEAPAHADPSRKKDPKIGVFGWDDGSEPTNSVFLDDPKFRPTKDQPLVYHLHGRLDQPKRIVLKVDDYFDYLIGVAGDRKVMPRVVRSKLTDCALMLLGYRIDDWDFRVLFRSIRSQPGAELLRNYKHVAVQLELENDRIVEPDLARRYFERYFQGAELTIYWGKTEDFLRELHEKWQARRKARANS
jgi:hypothetical protein